MSVMEVKIFPDHPLSNPLPSGDCVVICHAREGGHPGRWNYSIKLQLDSGACPGPDPGFAGMTALFHNYDTVSPRGRA